MRHPVRWLILVAIALILAVAAIVVFHFRSGHPAGEHITIDFFNDWVGDVTGEGTGWFAQIVEDEFNMTINYLGGDVNELFQTRQAAGDIGDLVIIAEHRLRQAANDGLLMDITYFVENRMQYYPRQFPQAVQRARGMTGNIYALPMQVSTQSPATPRISSMPPYGAFLRQDAYFAVGAPTLNVMENLLVVLSDMQMALPYTEDGHRTYGFSLYSGPEDDTILHTAAVFASLYSGMQRFSSTSFVDVANQNVESFLDDSGMYLRTLKLYFNANQMGLMDPASATQSFHEARAKFEQGSVLFSWWPWFGMPAFNTPGRVAQGIGFNFVPIMNQRIHHSTTIDPAGYNSINLVIGVGANAEDPGRIIDFIDWLASPTGHQTIVAGPEGLTWVMMDDNTPMLTDFGLRAGVHTSSFNNIDVPEDWGGGSFVQGGWHGNISLILDHYGREMNPETGFPYNPRLWSVENNGGTRLQTEWAERFGSNTPLDFVLDNNLIVTSPAVNVVMPADPANISAIRAAIRPIVEEASWRMIFAVNEAEFFQIWIDMQATAYEMGWDTVFQHDLALVREQFGF